MPAEAKPPNQIPDKAYNGDRMDESLRSKGSR